MTTTLVAVAAVDAESGHADRAVQLLAASATTRNNAGLQLREEERKLIDKAAQGCQALLGQETYRLVWDDGRFLSIGEAVDLARSGG
jgi:hypothetical protein